MPGISKRKALFGLIAIAGAAYKMARAFDHLQVNDISKAPKRIPALFSCRERVIGNPTQLFPKPSVKGGKSSKSTVLADTLEMMNGLNVYGIKGQLAGINTYLNGINNIEDIACSIKAKHWAAPINYFKSDEGSENYAIVKYVFLRKMGFHPERLRVVWVEEKETLDHHAVLTVILNGQTFVMENRFAEISNDIMLPRYRPYCSANEVRFSLHWDLRDRGGVLASLDRLARRPRIANA